MKSVLISIQPKWCEKIALGKKTVEVRKTKPKMETPFKCYIYQTNPKERLVDVIKDGDEIYGEIYHGKTRFIKTNNDGCHLAIHPIYRQYGKVIGEFVCDRIDHYEMEGYDKSDTIYQNIRRIEGDEEYDNFSWVMEVSNDMSEIEISNSKLLKQSCLSFGDIGKHVVGNKEFGFYDFYGWHISNLVIYDKPKGLSEFMKPCVNGLYCESCAMYSEFNDCCGNEALRVTRPPQSWCYVEKGGGDE